MVAAGSTRWDTAQMMKLKIGHVFEAAETVTTIINEKRPLPQKGAYRLARLYAKLKPEYDLIAARRNAMIEAYDYKPPHSIQIEGEPERLADNFSVPVEKLEHWKKAWTEVANEEIEVDVQPVRLEYLCAPDGGVGAITAAELIVLDDLVTE